MDSHAPLTPARVLVVDDDEGVRTFASRVLDIAGYTTMVAGDGAEALRIVEKQDPFNLVLADVVMPGMHGDELARQLMRREPDLKILYFTGYSDRLFAERMTLGENEAFLEKPVTMTGLIEAVSLMLSGHTYHVEPETIVDLSQPRSVRVAPKALAVTIGGTSGRLANISATGALVHLPHELRSDREWSLRIEVPPQPVELRARVVRSYSASVRLPEVMWQHPEFAVALAFIGLEPRTEEALKRLCAEVIGQRD